MVGVSNEDVSVTWTVRKFRRKIRLFLKHIQYLCLWMARLLLVHTIGQLFRTNNFM
uniref:Uncharacterized protein n=1 Tax=Ascaris lumbricoides TaxID=6252 RepID=A0A0M3I0L5_ASCLU